MKVKLKNIEILNILRWINSEDCILNKNSFELPVKIMWNINCNLNKLTEVQKIYSDTLNQINKKYSSDEKSVEIQNTNDDGTINTSRQVKPEYRNDFSAETMQLSLLETSIDVKSIKLSDLTDNGLEKCSFTDMSMLSFMIEG